MIKIGHIITGLGSGGAENMLYKLLKYSNRDKFYHEVISLLDEGVYGEKIKALGYKVHTLNLYKGNIFSALLTTKKLCREFDIVNTWLYHADLLGFLAVKLLPGEMHGKSLIWNIRHSNLDKDVNKKRTLFIVKINSFFSKKVNCITFNSHKAFNAHLSIGYQNKNLIVIPNGFELEKFKYNADARMRVRRMYNIDDNCKVFITVGRWEVQKDYPTLLKALHEVKKKHPNFKLIMVGTSLNYNNVELTKQIRNYDLQENVNLLGRREDIPDLLSGADCYISSSLGESFSNSIGEAMACELPCIVTDVGDSKRVIGDTGVVVPPKNYIELANSICNFLDMPVITRNPKARARVVENFSIEKIVNEFERNFMSVFNNVAGLN